MKKKLFALILAGLILSGCAKNIHWFRATDECCTDACITARTGDFNPADPCYSSGHLDEHIAFDEEL